jgi:hypothetical protein
LTFTFKTLEATGSIVAATSASAGAPLTGDGEGDGESDGEGEAAALGATLAATLGDALAAALGVGALVQFSSQTRKHFCLASHHEYPAEGMHPCSSRSPPTSVGVAVGAADGVAVASAEGVGVAVGAGFCCVQPIASNAMNAIKITASFFTFGITF